MLKLSQKAKNAVMLGFMCALAYLTVYLSRNILSTVSPQMIEGGQFSTEQIGALSSVFFISYAVGQLINGIVGDKIKAKYMISSGLIMAGIASVVFPLLVESVLARTIAYGISGFALSMIYAPMTKIVSENTEPIHAVRCSIGYTFASFFGSPLAGLLAAVFVWQTAFSVSSIALVVMGVTVFAFFQVCEKKGIVKYNQFKSSKKNGGGIGVLIKHQIIRYTFISIITGIVRTTVVFWMPTYISQYLDFSAESSALIFTVATLVISLSAFVAIFLYEKLNRNMNNTVLLSFISSAIMFIAVYFIKNPTFNIIFLVLAILSSNCAASVLWSMYCPSLKETGMVSSATGFLDFVSYMAAAVSSALFANAVSVIGWGNLILIWLGLIVIGIIVALPFKCKRENKI